MSIEESFEARRRMSCSRWLSASFGSTEVLIRYSPPESALHFSASASCPPLSGLMYYVIVFPPGSVWQPESAITAAPAAAARGSRRLDLRRLGLIIEPPCRRRNVLSAPTITPDARVWRAGFRASTAHPAMSGTAPGHDRGPGDRSPGPLLSRASDHSTILVTRPAPTVRPPSRMAKRRPSSMAIGWMSSTDMSVLSPGMTISVPSGSVMTPVTSVVRK